MDGSSDPISLPIPEVKTVLAGVPPVCTMVVSQDILTPGGSPGAGALFVGMCDGNLHIFGLESGKTLLRLRPPKPTNAFVRVHVLDTDGAVMWPRKAASLQPVQHVVVAANETISLFRLWMEQPPKSKKKGVPTPPPSAKFAPLATFKMEADVIETKVVPIKVRGRDLGVDTVSCLVAVGEKQALPFVPRTLQPLWRTTASLSSRGVRKLSVDSPTAGVPAASLCSALKRRGVDFVR